MSNMQYLFLGLALGSDISAFVLSIKPLENAIVAAGCVIAFAILEAAKKGAGE